MRATFIYMKKKSDHGAHTAEDLQVCSYRKMNFHWQAMYIAPDGRERTKSFKKRV